MAEVTCQGGNCKPPRLSTIEEEHEERKETTEVKYEAEGMKQEPVTDFKGKCEHYTSRISELMDILRSIELNAIDVTCQICDLGDLWMPLKKRKVVVPDFTFFWACLDCQQVFCGTEIPSAASEGHLMEHVRDNDHPLCVRLDELSEIWCLLCLVKENVGSTTTVWDELKADNSCTVKKLPNYGNTCYFNSLLQNLFAMDKLCESLVSLDQPVGDIARELKRLFVEAYDDSKGTIHPESLLHFVCEKKQFAFRTQQDTHELLIFLVGELISEGAKFADRIFSGEASNSLHCARCGRTWTRRDPFLDLSLAVPSTRGVSLSGGNAYATLNYNVPYAGEGDSDYGIGSAISSLLDDSDTASSHPINETVFLEDPFGTDATPTPVPLAYMVPGSSDPVPYSAENTAEVISLHHPMDNMDPDVPDPSDETSTLVKAREPLPGKTMGFSSILMAAKELDIYEANKSKFVSDEDDASVNEDVKTDVQTGKRSGDSSNLYYKRGRSSRVYPTKDPCGKFSNRRGSTRASFVEEVYFVDNTNGPVSIERCLDIYTQAEELSDTSCDGCSGKVQQQQQSETSGFQENGDISRSEVALDLPSKISDHNEDRCAESSLADGTRSSQTQTEADMNEHSENKGEQVKSKIIKKLFINNPQCAESSLADGTRSSQTKTEADMNEHSENKGEQVKSKITKKLFINNPPHILTIHLKRFTRTFQKIEGHIDFKELLDLTPYICGSSAEDKQYQYRLIGVVEHLGGTLCSGHYVAYVKREKRPGCKAWFKANDTEVEEVRLREVLKRDGYIFFYERLVN